MGICTLNYYLTGYALLLFIIRFCVQIIVINKNSRLFDAGKYHINLILFDLFQPFNNLRFRRYANRRNNTGR